MRFAVKISLLAFPAVLIGCQSAPKDSGFSNVSDLAHSRTGAEIRWNQSSAADREVESAVRQMLSRELSVDQAVQVALLNNHSLQAIYARLGIAQADLVQAGLLKNPVFDASIRFPDQSPNGPNVELSVSQEFIDLLFLPLRQKLAAAEFEQAKLEVAGAVVDRAAEVRAGYYTLAGTQKTLELRQHAVEAMRLSAETAQKLHDAGNLNRLGLANQQAAYEDARAELDSATAEAEQDRLALAALMGLRSDQTFSISDELGEPADAPSIDLLETCAISQRLDLASAKQALAVAKRSAKLTRTTAILSSASIGADTERETDGQRVTGPIFSIPIPLFDFGQAARMRSDAELQQAKEQYRALSVQVSAEVHKAAAKMAASRSRYERFRGTIVPLRHQVVEETQLRYNGMLMDVLQLLEARQREIDAQRDAIASLRDYWMARTELERAVGGRLPGDSATTQPATTQPATAPPSEVPSHSHES